MKAFYPAKPPFPLLHVDTTWKFREMIEFRDERAARDSASTCSCTSIREGVETGIDPVRARLAPAHRCDEDRALKQALDK